MELAGAAAEGLSGYVARFLDWASGLGQSGMAGTGAASEIQTGTTVYRVFGDGAEAFGKYWTTVNPNTVNDFRTAAGLFPQNTGRFVIEGTITDTTGITVDGAAAGPSGVGGGLTQVIIPNPEEQLIINQVSGVNPPF